MHCRLHYKPQGSVVRNPLSLATRILVKGFDEQVLLATQMF
jgi:hypothetical protein